MRDSTARRFAASMTESLKAKYKMKKEKEEREYAEALEREMKERANLERIKAEILKARMGIELNEKANEMSDVERELQTLYERIFNGPTPDFPRDDELKNNLRFAQATQRQIQDQVDNYLQVAELLQQAWRKLYRCSEALHMALENSGDETDGRWLTIAEGRKALEKAILNVFEAQRLVSQAQSLSPDEIHVGDIPVRKNSQLFTEVVALRMNAFERAEANIEELQIVQQRVQKEHGAAKSRATRVANDLIEAAEVIAQCKEALMEHRRATVERVVELGRDSPPLYQRLAETNEVSVVSPQSSPDPQDHDLPSSYTGIDAGNPIVATT